jgi:DNA-binding response OmpR family regulator
MDTVLVVDDESRLRTMLCRLLEGAGHTAVAAPDGQAALHRLADHEIDLVLLDLTMPTMSGLRVLEVLRDGGSTVPVIVLSAVNEVDARVQALDLGAVDFVGKPFHTPELLARVRRNLAPRVPAQVRRRHVEAGGVRLDLDRRRAEIDGTEVALTVREFGLLAHLMRHRGEVCGRQELLHDVWGLDFDPGTNVVDACVRRLRRKLPSTPIETIRSAGYCFHAT